MALSTISNDFLKVEINSLGAELFSVVHISSGRECLWQGTPEFWKSRSPVLFPIVGGLHNLTMRHQGGEYSMTQHGFARASEFAIIKHEADEIVFRLESSDATREKYPFEFSLEIGYKLSDSNIYVSYRVVNPSTETLHFQIGAHPGFNYIDYDPTAEVQGYLEFDDKTGSGNILSGIINDKGMLIEREKTLPLTDKLLAIDKDSFNDGAFIIEDDQTSDIALCDRDKEPYVRVTFDTPVVGVWSCSKGSYAPFVCIEPWLGRCAKEGYQGEFADKDWMQHLCGNSEFKTGFNIWIAK
ncbi:MAG: aldose 1-epimerase family protein [Rikenellaceae bacterium]